MQNMLILSTIMLLIIIELAYLQIINPKSKKTTKDLGTFQSLLMEISNRNRVAYLENLEQALRQPSVIGNPSAEELFYLRMPDDRLPHIQQSVINRQQQYSDKTFLQFPTGAFKAQSVVFPGNSSLKLTQREALKYKKLQEVVPSDVPFPCDLRHSRSKMRPTSADKLRPGDIDLLASIGDSILAGLGIFATNLPQLIVQYNGFVASNGGTGTWRQYLTLGNILKEFNPKIKGLSKRDSIYPIGYDSTSYNIAVPGALVDDMFTMAQTFVNKMKRDPGVDLKNDWKMLAYFGGAVDQCSDICYWKNLEDSITYHYRMLEKGLDYLMNNSPRTIVAFIIPPNIIRTLPRVKDLPATCELSNLVFCPCGTSRAFNANVEKYAEFIERIINTYLKLIRHPKYQEKKDFAVVPLNFMSNFTMPKVWRRGHFQTDYRYFAPDCFHYSQRGHASFANSIWNALVTPENEQADHINWTPYQEFKCPTQQSPYIIVPNNSRLREAMIIDKN